MITIYKKQISQNSKNPVEKLVLDRDNQTVDIFYFDDNNRCSWKRRKYNILPAYNGGYFRFQKVKVFFFYNFMNEEE